MNTHNGKIGRLPETTRNELNQRLADGGPAAPLLQWLNALPKVQAVLADRFHAEPVNDPHGGGRLPGAAARDRGPAEFAPGAGGLRSS